MIDFTKAEGWLWLEKQPRAVAIVIMARAALRVLPLMFAYQRTRPSRAFFTTKALPTFHAGALSWAAATVPTRNLELRAAATSVVDGLHQAYYDSGSSNDETFTTAHSTAVFIAGGNRDATLRARFDTGFLTPPYLNVPADAYVAANQLCSEEATAIEAEPEEEARIRMASNLAVVPLWPGSPPISVTPTSVTQTWARLRAALLAEDEDWDVWVRWYEDRLLGRPSLGDIFDIAVATLPEELWRQGPKAVNAEIRRLIELHTSPEPIPAQGAGPQFGLNPDLRITLAPPSELDIHGNNLPRIRQQLPLVRQAAGDLARNLNPNTQPELAGNLADYRAAIADNPEKIAWGIVFGLGVRLDNAAAAARREIANRMREPLEDAAQEALDSVLMLHGPLIMATAEGRELSDEADRFRLTRDQQAILREDAQAIAEDLKNSPNIIEAPAAELGQKAAESIGEGDHPERGTAFGLATVKNVTTVLVSAGTLAAFIPAGAAAAGLLGGAAAAGVAWVGYEALKKSQRFTAATSALGGGFDRLHDLSEAQILRRLIALAPFRRFVRANEGPLRRIAQNSTQLRWALRYIDFIVRTNGSDDGAN